MRWSLRCLGAHTSTVVITVSTSGADHGPVAARHAESVAATDEPLLRVPDSGHRFRKPEFYAARAQVQRQMALEAQALARQHELAAEGYWKRADKCIEHAELMEKWAAEGAQTDGTVTE